MQGLWSNSFVVTFYDSSPVRVGFDGHHHFIPYGFFRTGKLDHKTYTHLKERRLKFSFHTGLRSNSFVVTMYVACDSGDATEGLGGGNSYAATFPIQRSIGTQRGPLSSKTHGRRRI